MVSGFLFAILQPLDGLLLLLLLVLLLLLLLLVLLLLLLLLVQRRKMSCKICFFCHKTTLKMLMDPNSSH